MNGIEVYLNGEMVPSPTNLNEFAEEIIRDYENRIIRFDYPTTIKLSGRGFELLDQLYQQSADSSASVDIIDAREGTARRFMRGIIKIVNCTFNLQRRTVECEIDDLSFQNAVFARRQVPFYVTSQETFGGKAMDGISPIALTMFDRNTGDDIAPPKQAYDVIDVMSKLVEYITDGTVAFESPWYASLPDDQKLAITTGDALRRTDEQGQPPIVEFQDLFEELYRRYNLWIVVTDGSQGPTLSMVQEPETYQAVESARVRAVAELERGIDFDQLFSSIELGSSTSVREFDIGTDFPYIPLLTFVDETYAVRTINGVDNVQELSYQYISDHNLIVRQLSGEDNDRPGEIYFVQYNSETLTATKGKYWQGLNEDYTLYNEQHLNFNIAQRFTFAGPLVLTGGLTGGANFRASQIGTLSYTGILSPAQVDSYLMPANDAWILPDDSTPPNFNEGAYDNTTYRYTAVADGFHRLLFGFRVTFLQFTPLMLVNLFAVFRTTAAVGSYVADNILIQTYSGAGVLQASFTIALNEVESDLNWIAAGTYLVGSLQPTWYFEVTMAQTINLSQGEEVWPNLSVQFGSQPGVAQNVSYNVQINRGTFLTEFAPVNVGKFTQGDPDDVYLGKYIAEHVDCNNEQYRAIRATPQRYLTIDTGKNDPRICYPKKITRNLVTGKTDIEAVFNRRQAIL